MTAMAATGSNSHFKQIKALPAERINSKIKIQNKQDYSSMTNGNVTTNGSAPTTNAKATAGQQGEGPSLEQRRRVSGRPQMTAEEQKLALRKKVPNLRVNQLTITGRAVYTYHQRFSIYLSNVNILVRNSTTNILAKYKDQVPSLIIHLHPTHFRFDQQDGVFSYNSPMKV
jgi:hypothetical protein